MVYTCELCQKTFDQKGDYTRHTQKKNACISPEKVLEMKKELLEQEALNKKYEPRLKEVMTAMGAEMKRITKDPALARILAGVKGMPRM